MNLSQHFTLEELTASQWAARMGVDNTPNATALENLRATALHMENVRARLGNLPIAISSGYRNLRVNAAVGGVATSAHVSGYAVDFTCPEFGGPLDVAKFLARQAGLEFDQLIYEFGSWVHLSFDPRKRRQCLSIRSSVEGYVALDIGTGNE